MNAIKKDKMLKLSTIVTGMHLNKEFGYSINEIIKDGFEINARVRMDTVEDNNFCMATSIGKGIIGIAKEISKIKPDLLLVLGDRTEALAGTIAAAYMNTPIAHIHGGDSGRAGLDEPARHAITKFAHIHFPATKKSADRIIKMGEDKKNVFITGAPCIETILNEDLLTEKEIEKKIELDLQKPLILLIQHAVSTEPEKAKEQIIETLKAIEALKYQTVIIYPNSDAGGREIIKQIKRYQHLPYIKTYKNLLQKEYLSILKYSSVMLGNSSSGIIESSSFKTPVVNIGIRQEGRERAENVIDCDHKKDDIIKAVKKALYDEDFKKRVNTCENPYGKGKTSELIVKILKENYLNNDILKKKLTY